MNQLGESNWIGPSRLGHSQAAGLFRLDSMDTDTSRRARTNKHEHRQAVWAWHGQSYITWVGGAHHQNLAQQQARVHRWSGLIRDIEVFVTRVVVDWVQPLADRELLKRPLGMKMSPTAITAITRVRGSLKWTTSERGSHIDSQPCRRELVAWKIGKQNPCLGGQHDNACTSGVSWLIAGHEVVIIVVFQWPEANGDLAGSQSGSGVRVKNTPKMWGEILESGWLC